jgi:hypothetical protein
MLIWNQITNIKIMKLLKLLKKLEKVCMQLYILHIDSLKPYVYKKINMINKKRLSAAIRLKRIKFA